MDKLKPCPFCGGKAGVVYGAKRKDAYGKDCTVTVVYCDTCCAKIEMSKTHLAIEAWNRRAGESDGM